MSHVSQRPSAIRISLAIVALAVVACGRSPEPSRPVRAPATRRTVPAVDVGEVAALPPSTSPAPERLVAIGDVHGDLAAFRSVLRLAGAIDGSDHWSGGALWIVQTGDLLDRGDDEREILDLVTQLEREASAAGGRFVALHGNHEIMNAQGDFRYVTPGGYADFDDLSRDAPRRLPREVRGRTAAFAPGGRYARELATRNTVVVIGDTIFAHGGVLPAHVDAGLDTINRAVRAFFLEGTALPPMLLAEDSPVWHRAFALETDEATCARLEATLSRAGVRRMVIGHTVQRTGINAACDERVWRIDVGLARLYEGPIEALEIAGGSVRVLHGSR